MAKWIRFRLADEQKPKTKVWDVLTADNEENFLGRIKWFGRWRKYSFFPASYTIFENQCLRDIADFMEEEMRKRKELSKTRSQN